MSERSGKRSGFTLIEVILSLGLLSIVIVSTFSYLYSVKMAEEIDKTVTDLNIIVQNQTELVMAAESVTEMYSLMTTSYAYTDSTTFQGWLDSPDNFRSVGTGYEYAIGVYQLESENKLALYQFAVYARSKEDPSRQVLLMTVKSVEEL
jgi:prepilin-type N-terminal cleavage/methylation domain-containing protein